MSLVAIALVLGLAFCIERVIYLTLAQVNTRKFLETLRGKVEANKLQEAIDYCAGTRGPVAQVSKKAMQCLASDDQNDIAPSSVTSTPKLRCRVLTSRRTAHGLRCSSPWPRLSASSAL